MIRYDATSPERRLSSVVKFFSAKGGFCRDKKNNTLCQKTDSNDADHDRSAMALTGYWMLGILLLLADRVKRNGGFMVQSVDEMLPSMDELSILAGRTLPKGGGEIATAQAQEIKNELGVQILEKLVKKHFSNYKKIN